ncbi:membrane protein FAM174B [Acomys russatus]|uniref:membrane protein FAM174B n=1 Tax=Acomys russatus TaxID=60746 RepID=UPI0021E2E3A6|nr:membrane protein FAM174B [Acomys russatus]
MSALPSPPPLLLLLALLAAPSVLARRAESASASQPEADHQLPLDPGNGTRLGSGVAGGRGSNSSSNAVVTRISSLLRDLPTLKATVIVACAFSALLIACLLLRVFRSGKRLKKTRKYDIITTPAERVEMAPLNEEDDEDEDATVFDIKYRYGLGQRFPPGLSRMVLVLLFVSWWSLFLSVLVTVLRDPGERGWQVKTFLACQHPVGSWSAAAWDVKVWAPSLIGIGPKPMLFMKLWFDFTCPA